MNTKERTYTQVRHTGYRTCVYAFFKYGWYYISRWW